LVGHKHITVNGEVVNIASYTLKAGDVIAVREKSKTLEAITHAVAGKKINKHSWLEWDAANLTGKFLNYPNRDEIPENIKENLIVELYSNL
jgi:small subunit ribosomal protein S4